MRVSAGASGRLDLAVGVEAGRDADAFRLSLAVG
jgi:hypothetical protein